MDRWVPAAAYPPARRGQHGRRLALRLPSTAAAHRQYEALFQFLRDAKSAAVSVVEFCP